MDGPGRTRRMLLCLKHMCSETGSEAKVIIKVVT